MTERKDYTVVIGDMGIGVYRGSDEAEALDACAVDLGYQDRAELLGAVPESENTHAEEINL